MIRWLLLLLNPLTWIRFPVYCYRGFRLLKGISGCLECDRRKRGDHVRYGDMCGYHQESLRIQFGNDGVQRYRDFTETED